ncbi:MAG: copper amine oxidase N-terminal domain-containing protein, partial [Sulfurihydrogenibium sp.]|nr:copper amine oxidase N-terminal domain-containing protein [Sulfurihydrogenibium sp.]
MVNLKKNLIIMIFAAIMLLNFVMPINRLNQNAFGSSVIVAVPSCILSNTASQDPIGVIIFQVGSSTFTINGESKTFDTPPVIKNGRTLLPIKPLIESLNGFVFWSPSERKVTVNFGDKNIELW